MHSCITRQFRVEGSDEHVSLPQCNGTRIWAQLVRCVQPTLGSRQDLCRDARKDLDWLVCGCRGWKDVVHDRSADEDSGERLAWISQSCELQGMLKGGQLTTVLVPDHRNVKSAYAVLVLGLLDVCHLVFTLARRQSRRHAEIAALPAEANHSCAGPIDRPPVCAHEAAEGAHECTAVLVREQRDGRALASRYDQPMTPLKLLHRSDENDGDREGKVGSGLLEEGSVLVKAPLQREDPDGEVAGNRPCHGGYP